MKACGNFPLEVTRCSWVDNVGSGPLQISKCQTLPAWIREIDITDALSVVESENVHMLVAVTYITPILIYWAPAHIGLMKSLDTCGQKDCSFSGIGISITQETRKLRKQIEYAWNKSEQSRFWTMQKLRMGMGTAAPGLKPLGRMKSW